MINIIISFIQSNKLLKLVVFSINDVFLIIISGYFSLVIRYESISVNTNQLFIFYLISFISYFSLTFFFKTYSQLQRYFNINSVKFYSKIFFFYFLLSSILILVLNFFIIIPRSLSIINTFLFFIVIILNRFILTLFINYKKDYINQRKVIAYGTYDNIIKLINNLPLNYRLISIILIDTVKVHTINGIKTYHKSKIDELLNFKYFNTLILAVNNEAQVDIKNLIKKLYAHNINLLKFDSNSFQFFSQNIDIESLLFREEITKGINFDFQGKNILISGGGGSIGSEIGRQILKLNPSKLLIIDNSEFNLFKTSSSLKKLHYELNSKSELLFQICDINNIEDLNFVLSNIAIDFIFHAAAFKHVPIVEENIFQALKNNFFSTYNLGNFAIKNNIKKFTFISTDKAVRPTNIMGATKRLAELSIIYLNQKYSKTKFSIVRFGNVLESSGSVIPIFKEQINKGGPITVTHEEMTRYFMSIEEAALLVLQSTNLMNGGEIFLLDMGNPVKILDLAKKMIKLSGKSLKDLSNPHGEIEIKIIGLRKGEKLYEELLIDNSSKQTKNKFIYQSLESFIENSEFENFYREIKNIYIEKNVTKLKKILGNSLIKYKEN